MRFVELSVATFICAGIGVTIQRMFGWPIWGSYVVCAAMGIVLHLVAIWLTELYTRTETPLLDAARGIARVTPLWVRLLGTIGMGFALAIPFQFVAALLL